METFSIITSSKLGLGFKAHSRYYSFEATAKSNRKRVRTLATSRLSNTAIFGVNASHSDGWRPLVSSRPLQNGQETKL